jgi:hypothetical protein
MESVKMESTITKLTSGGTFQSWLIAGRIILTPIHIKTKARPTLK